ncbi:hypothetical protein CC2G_006612 [Coprinopsis cinerea AmutBmut pab1-1]|nr:hypothetical protein CC2G_006612 [Coprinopsis cinerea AmutBmut pab1-1]
MSAISAFLTAQSTIFPRPNPRDSTTCELPLATRFLDFSVVMTSVWRPLGCYRYGHSKNLRCDIDPSLLLALLSPFLVLLIPSPDTSVASYWAQTLSFASLGQEHAG